MTSKTVSVPRDELRSLADILASSRTKTDSGLPVTVAECIDVAQAAAAEMRGWLGAVDAGSGPIVDIRREMAERVSAILATGQPCSVTCAGEVIHTFWPRAR